MKSPNQKFRRAILTGSILQAIFVTSAVAATWNGTPVSLDNNPLFNEGLKEGFTNTNNDFTTPIGSANLGPNFGESLNLRMGNSGLFGASDGWADNRTWIYSGEMFTGPNGIISIAANNDDTDWFRVDGTVVLQDTAWNVPNATVVQGLTPNSWVPFEYRVANGGGGAGPSGQNTNGGLGWVSGSIGVVMSHDNESNSVVVSDYSGGAGLGLPAEVFDGTPTLFRYSTGGGVPADNITITASTPVTMSGTGAVVAETFLRFLGPAGTTSITLTVNSSDATVRTLQSGLTSTAWVDGSTAIFAGSANVRLGQTQDNAFSGNFIIKNGGTGELIFDNATNDLNGSTLQVVDGLVSIKGNSFNPISTLANPIEINSVNARLKFGPVGSNNIATTFNNSINFNDSGTLEHTAPRFDIIGGDITIATGNTLNANIAAGTLQAIGNVSGPEIVKTGAGTFTVGSGVTNVAIQTSSVSAGKLAFSGSTQFGTVPTILPGGTLSLNGPADSTYSIPAATQLNVPTGGTLELYPSLASLPTNLTGGTLILDSNHGLLGEYWAATPNNVAGVAAPPNNATGFNSLWDTRGSGDVNSTFNVLIQGTGQANGTNTAGNGVFADFQNTFSGLGSPTVSAFTADRGVQEFNFPSTDGAPFGVYGFNSIDNIQARWSGVISIKTEGVYQFSTTSDDGSAIFIDGESVVNNNRYQGMQNRAGSVFLTAGLHQFVMGFYEGTGGAGMQAFVTAPGGTNQFLNNTTLFPSSTVPSFANPIDVQQDSTINTAYFEAIQSEITVQNTKMLTTTGNQLTVNTLKLRNTGGVYNINTSGAGNVLIAKAIDDNAGTNITINKTGDGLFVLDNTTTAQLANPASVLNLNAGSLGVLLQTGGLSPTGSAAINFNGGGLVLSSKGGNQTYNLPPVFGGTNPALEARKVGSGVAGTTATPITVDLNGNLNIPGGQVLGLKTADNYILTIGGTAVVGPTVGAVSVNGGRVNTVTPNAVTGLNVAFGTPSGVLGTFNIRSANPSIASVSGGATGIANLAIGDGTSNSTLTINQSTDTQFGGNFTQEGTTVAGVVKLGTGTLTLTGLASNYSGGLTITGGKVISNGASLGSGVVTLNGGTLAAVPNGLLGEYWDVTKGGDGNAQTGFGGDLTQFNNYFAGKGSAVLAAPTTTGGRTNLRFSTGNGGLDGGGFDPGAPFADQGFIPEDNIAVRFSGTFFAEVAGDYSFLTRSDDGSVLFVDGTKVVNNNNYQGMTNATGTINLAAGTHAISVGFYEGGGGAGLEVRYTPPGGVDQFITNDILGGLNTTSNVQLQSSSTIDPAGGSSAFGALTTAPNLVLTALSGSAKFSGTTFTGATGGIYEFNKSGTGILTLGPLNTTAAGANSTTIRKTGDGTLLLGAPTTPQLSNISDVVNVLGGRVVAVGGVVGANPLGQASVQLASGGVIALSTVEPAVTFNNPITITGSGGVAAGNFGSGAVDNSTVTIGLPLTVTAGNTLTVSASNGYTLNLNTVSGGGNITADGSNGTINANAALNVGQIVVRGNPTLTNVYGATLNTNDATTATSAKIEAGGVLHQDGSYTTTAGDTTIENNGEFQVTGGAINTNVVLKGGVLRALEGVNDFGNRVIAADTTALVQDRLAGVVHLSGGGLAPNNFDGMLAIQLRKPSKTPVEITGQYAAQSDAAFGTLFNSTEIAAGQNFTAMALGRFTPTATGIYRFQSGTVDDNGAFWVDLNRNGIFETANGSAGNELLSGQGCCIDGPIGEATLVAGQSYNVAFGVEDTGGGSGYTARFQRPSDGALINVDPSTQPGLWSRVAPLTGGAVVLEGATPEPLPKPAAELRAAGINNVATVALNGDGAKLALNSTTPVTNNVGNITAFPGPVFTGTTLELGALNTLVTDSLTVAVDGTLIKTGDGTLTATSQSLGARVNNLTAPALQVNAGIVNLNGAVSALNQGAVTANTGNVVVNGGVLNVNGAISGIVTVNAGGKLGGTGTVGATTINGTPGLPGILSPGLSAGTLSTGSLSLTSDARFEFELGDLVNVTGDLTLDGVLGVNVGGLSDGTYRLINYTGALTDNVLTLDPAFLLIFPGSSISTATANQVNLVVIPEPGAFAALLGGMGLLAGLRRYRRS